MDIQRCLLNNVDAELLTVKETAKIFKVEESTVYSWIRRNKNNELPPNLVFKLGGTVRIRRKVLEKFITGELV